MITLNGTTGITTPGLINTGSTTFVDLTTTGNTILGDASTDTLNVANGNLVLNSSGNLGLGVTPSAWDTLKAIQLSGGSLASFSTYQNFLSANAFYQGGWKYVSTTTAGQYLQDGNVHKWYRAPSGTAGNAITFTQAMTFDASGRLGLGGSTYPGEELDVQGNILILNTGKPTMTVIYYSRGVL